MKKIKKVVYLSAIIFAMFDAGVMCERYRIIERIINQTES